MTLGEAQRREVDRKEKHCPWASELQQAAGCLVVPLRTLLWGNPNPQFPVPFLESGWFQMAQVDEQVMY